MADLIDRSTLAEEIESLTVTVAGKPARWYDAKHSVLQVIAEQPTIDPESLRHKGEWKLLPTGEIIEFVWECSNCKHKIGVPFKFCPNCGADMRGE